MVIKHTIVLLVGLVCLALASPVDVKRDTMADIIGTITGLASRSPSVETIKATIAQNYERMQIYLSVISKDEMRMVVVKVNEYLDTMSETGKISMEMAELIRTTVASLAKDRLSKADDDVTTSTVKPTSISQSTSTSKQTSSAGQTSTYKPPFTIKSLSTVQPTSTAQPTSTDKPTSTATTQPISTAAVEAQSCHIELVRKIDEVLVRQQQILELLLPEEPPLFDGDDVIDVMADPLTDNGNRNGHL